MSDLVRFRVLWCLLCFFEGYILLVCGLRGCSGVALGGFVGDGWCVVCLGLFVLCCKSVCVLRGWYGGGGFLGFSMGSLKDGFSMVCSCRVG